MKKSLMITIIFASLLFSITNLTTISAEACSLDVKMVNQDPYPAIPGDYVKIVFQVEGISNSDCGEIEFELAEKYPISFDPDEKSKLTINSGVYSKDFSSFLLAPYKVRVDENALNGDNPIEVKFNYGLNKKSFLTKQFDLNIEDSRADFEVFVKSYNFETKEITFQILNIAESDIEALTLEILPQENIIIKGSKINIVGDLDSNEYTTADFEATPKKGNITIKISYSDATNTRRTLEKTVAFEPSYFENRVSDQKKTSKTSYLIGLIIIILIIWYVRRRRKKKKDKQHQRR